MSDLKLLEKLEEIKDYGAYSLSVNYGSHEVGEDDTGVKPSNRKILVYWRPTGYTGEVAEIYKGTVGEFINNFDVENSKPKQLNNPPEQYMFELDEGHYFWGNEEMVEDFKKDKGFIEIDEEGKNEWR